MELAGKYAENNRLQYEPDVFPDQRLMQALASQTNDPELRNAALDFQYPFKKSDLQSSKYSSNIKESIMRVAMGQLG
jgi:hypothetical protein